MSSLRRSDSDTGSFMNPVGDRSSSTSVSSTPGFGSRPVAIWRKRTPNENTSSFSVYTGGVSHASGGMYTGQPGT